MLEIIDLSQEIFQGMPVFPSLPEVKITIHQSHEQLDGITDSDVVSPAVNRLEFGEHTGTHVDALNHMGREFRGQSIDTMPLTMFYTEGICLDLSHKGLRELIGIADLERALFATGLEIKRGDTVLLYTDHYRRAYGTEDWHKGPGVSIEAARWLGEQRIAAFGVEPAAPGVRGVSNKEVHHICWELGFTHYENMMNLHRLVGRGRFRFIGLPLRIRGGTGLKAHSRWGTSRSEAGKSLSRFTGWPDGAGGRGERKMELMGGAIMSKEIGGFTLLGPFV